MKKIPAPQPAPVEVTQETVEAWKRKWARILRLQDWDVQIKLVRAYDIDPGRMGCVSWVLAKKAASIKILDPRDYDPKLEWDQDAECTVVHELVHLHAAPVDTFDGLPEKLLEQAVDCIAKALIDLDREPNAGGGLRMMLHFTAWCFGRLIMLAREGYYAGRRNWTWSDAKDAQKPRQVVRA